MKILFIPHAKFLKYRNSFKIPSYIHIPNNVPFHELLVETDLLVTDFSSNSFEMAYMDKPTVNYIPDLKVVLEGTTQYSIEAMAKYPHMHLCRTQAQAFSQIDALLNGKQKFDFSR